MSEKTNQAHEVTRGYTKSCQMATNSWVLQSRTRNIKLSTIYI